MAANRPDGYDCWLSWLVSQVEGLGFLMPDIITAVRAELNEYRKFKRVAQEETDGENETGDESRMVAPDAPGDRELR